MRIGSNKLPGQLGGVIARAILNQKQFLGGLFQHLFEKGDVAIGIEASLHALIEQAPTKELNQSEHFVAFAFATGLHQGLVTDRRPGITERPPLRKTGFVAKEQPSLGGFRLPFEVGENLGHPQPPFGFIQMIGHKPGFLIGKAQSLQEFTQVMGIVEYAKAVPDQVLDQQTRPASGGITSKLWPSFNQLTQYLSLGLGQFRRATSFPLWLQTMQPLHQQLVEPQVKTGDRNAMFSGNLGWFVPSIVIQQDQNPAGHLGISALIGLLKQGNHLLDGFVADTYSYIHHRWLSGYVMESISSLPTIFNSDYCFSNLFSEGL